MDFKGRITIYSITGCRHCKAAKSKLDDMNLPYVDVNLDDEKEIRDQVITLTGSRTVPQIYFNAKHIGGNDHLQKLTEEEMSSLIELVKNNETPADAPPLPVLSENDTNNPDHAYQQQEDENAKLINDFKASGIIKDHRALLTVHHSCFSGIELVSWLMDQKKLDRKSATAVAENLLKLHFFGSINGEETFRDNCTLYRLLLDEKSNALNANVALDIKPMKASELAIEIRKKILGLYSEFLSSDGRCVDYEGIKQSDLFKEFVQLTGQLQRLSVDDLSREEKLAFFINIYNALVIHGNVELGFPNSFWKRYKFFNTVSYRIGGQNYSLQDIENGILRANRKGLGMMSRPFSKSDPRLKVALKEHEPLVHFALVCGAKSCPPIKTYSADGIYDQLKCSAEAFLEGDDGCSLDSNKKIVKLSKILDWYKVDFNNGKNVEWVCNILPNSNKKEELSKLVQNGGYKVTYMPYDWGSNDKPKKEGK